MQQIFSQPAEGRTCWHNDFLWFKLSNLVVLCCKSPSKLYIIHYSEMWHKRLRKFSTAWCLGLYMGENNSKNGEMGILLLENINALCNEIFEYILKLNSELLASTSLLGLDFSYMTFVFMIFLFLCSSVFAELMRLLIARKQHAGNPCLCIQILIC